MFLEGGEFVNITDSEGGPTATGMIPEGGTTEKKLPSTSPPPPPPPPYRLINGTALKKAFSLQTVPPEQRVRNVYHQYEYELYQVSKKSIHV